MVFEFTAGDRVGVAVQSLNHSAILSPLVDKSEKIAVYSALLFFFVFPDLSNIFQLECAHLCQFISHFFRTGCFLSLTMNLLLKMSCLYYIVFLFLVGAQKDSDRDGTRTHARKPYSISSSTP